MTDSLVQIIAGHLEDGEEARITAAIVALPPDEIPSLLYVVMQRRRFLDRIEDVCEARAAADGLKEWVAPSGEVFKFGTGRKRVVASPRKLESALREIMAQKYAPFDPFVEHPESKMLRAAFREKIEVLLTALDSFLALDPAYAEAAEPYITWEDAGPMHLRPVEDHPKRSGSGAG